MMRCPVCASMLAFVYTAGSTYLRLQRVTQSEHVVDTSPSPMPVHQKDTRISSLKCAMLHSFKYRTIRFRQVVVEIRCTDVARQDNMSSLVTYTYEPPHHEVRVGSCSTTITEVFHSHCNTFIATYTSVYNAKTHTPFALKG